MSASRHIELRFDDTHPVRRGSGQDEGFARDVLLSHAGWFVRIRWVVVGILAAYGLMNMVWPEVVARLSLVPAVGWPWALACALTVSNVLFRSLLRSAGPAAESGRVVNCIWLQILTDLMVLTVLVHEVGSTGTFIAFAYLFHIVLACIFFAPRDSFMVTVLAVLLFIGCLVLETNGILPRHSLLVESRMPTSLPVTILNACSAVFIWFVVWYLASTLSKSVQARDRELAEANELLVEADREKNLLMLRTVHDLKAPFSSIESNIEVLRMQDWDALPASARTLINSIEVRAATLRERIRDILLLGELRESYRQAGPAEPVDLDELLETVVGDLAGRASQRRVTVRRKSSGLRVRSNRKQLGILFSNLIANAIAYSREGGDVEVEVQGASADVRVIITDHGIGISEKALPRIFDEYFRAPEAAQFNLLSTGLGLAIVKHVAQSLGLVISVTSEEGRGTSVEVTLARLKGGVRHGTNSDC